MCDVEKYKKIYQEIAQLDPEDTLQLILEADTEEQREFYQVVGDFLLQKIYLVTDDPRFENNEESKYR